MLSLLSILLWAHHRKPHTRRIPFCFVAPKLIVSLSDTSLPHHNIQLSKRIMNHSLGSVFRSHTNGNCKKATEINSNIHSRQQHLARRPKYDKKQHQNFYRPVRQGGGEGGRTQRVHFLPTESSNDDKQKVPSPHSATATAVVNRLQWTDHKGFVGNYTGQVNALKQPHGTGALVYENGSARSCIWRNGMPVQLWTPKKNKKNGNQVGDNCNSRVLLSSSSPTSTSCMDSTNNNKISTGSRSNATFLPHLDIGDVVNPQDNSMIREKYPSLNDIDSLKLHDFAFILRSDGLSWTYCIIANRTADSILFAVDTDGSTKTVPRSRWSTCVRLVDPTRAKAVVMSSQCASPSSSSRLENDSSIEMFPTLPFWYMQPYFLHVNMGLAYAYPVQPVWLVFRYLEVSLFFIIDSELNQNLI